jgi:predicted Zn-dependent protease
MSRDADAEPVLREALKHARGNPALLHTLGLVMVRQKRLVEATEWLGAAARLGPENPRFGYVYGVALHDVGQTQAALDALAAVLARHPYDRDSLAAVASFHHQLGDEGAARRYAARLAALDASAQFQ